jgi:hypothetical protein
MICTLRNCSGHQIKEDWKVAAYGTYGEKRNPYRVLVRKHGRTRPRHREENNDKTDFKKLSWRMWAGFTWLRRSANDGFLSTLYRTLGFY